MRVTHLIAPLLVVALSACARDRASSSEPSPRAVDSPQPAAPSPNAEPQPGGAVGPRQATAQAIAPLDKKQFGAPITEAKTTPLPALLQQPSKFGGKTIRTEGVVSAVCKQMGCWMELADEAGSAHVKMAGHSFFVPRDASGHRAVVQGKMVTAAAEEGGACGASGAKDGCREEAEKQTGQVAKIEIEATGVEFLD